MFVIHQAVVKAMELLALEGKIKEKTYGKQKIYFADQVSLFICVAVESKHVDKLLFIIILYVSADNDCS